MYGFQLGWNTVRRAKMPYRSNIDMKEKIARLVYSETLIKINVT